MSLPRLFTLLMLALSTSTNASAAPHCGIERFPHYQLDYCMHPAPGPLLVLDAAQGTDMQVWGRAFISELKGFASVLTFNRIGSGKSRFTGHRLNKPVTAKDSSDRLHRLLQRLAPGRQSSCSGIR